ncbi:hypothetical protein J2S43_002443 [Catenuloplanes nepalensis]|uniref:Uncharacterized protein n=1 Tax=Catenuloplanes nepalensis TaxID=587533 RepID=A0ABT9MR71_9ACTN|nr:hypothetical protein [Catenuloplanes nepalensis]MDP9793931.1 hypothetical protein [Catenuloplanes nepalensis]
MSEEIAVRRSGDLGRLPSVPVHQARELEMSAVALDADECWASLGAALRARIEQRAGPVVEWWAWEQDGRVHVVVLGRIAFVRCIPTTTARGSAHRVETMRLMPETVRTVPIRDNAPRNGPRVGNRSAEESAGAGRIDLPADFRAVIGHIPARAQILLQEPFVTHSGPLLADSCVYQTVNRRGMGSVTMKLWCYLTDYRTLTVVSGTGVSATPGSPVGWDLMCRRIAVGAR